MHGTLGGLWHVNVFWKVLRSRAEGLTPEGAHPCLIVEQL